MIFYGDFNKKRCQKKPNTLIINERKTRFELATLSLGSQSPPFYIVHKTFTTRKLRHIRISL